MTEDEANRRYRLPAAAVIEGLQILGDGLGDARGGRVWLGFGDEGIGVADYPVKALDAAQVARMLELGWSRVHYRETDETQHWELQPEIR